MQLHLEGSTELNQAPDIAFQRLTNLEVMTKALPDAEDVRVIDDNTAEATVKLKIALVSIKLRMTVKVLNKRPPSHAELSAEGRGSGSRVKILSTFDLEPAMGGAGTKMAWKADADIGGLMAGIGSAVLKGFAEKRVGEIFDAIRMAAENQRT